jgi:signal transduction histidine kinase
MPLAFRVFVSILALVSCAILPSGIALAAREPGPALLWLVFISAANLLTIPMLPKLNIDATVGVPVSVAAAVVLAPPLAFVVNAFSLASERELRRGVSPWLRTFNHCQLGLSALAAAYAAEPYRDNAPVLATVIAVLVYNLVNTAAITVDLRLRGHRAIGKAAIDLSAPFPRFAVEYGLVALLASLVVIAEGQVGETAVLFLAMPLWLGYSALRSARVAEDRAEELAAQVEELQVLNRLGTALLAVRRPDEVTTNAAAALRLMLPTGEVEVSLAGAVDASLQAVKVPGAEPAVIGVPAGLPGGVVAVVEAAAGLLGMALQRVALETEVAEGQRARAALSGRILEEGTRERSRIALAIHDEVLPFLAAAEIQADNVRSALQGGDPDRADGLAAATQHAVHDGIASLRDVLDALRRQIVVPGGLREGLIRSLEELRVTGGVSHTFEAPDPLPPLPLAVEIMVLELVRGCLVNVARHADARHVRVRLEVAGDVLEVEVADDGRGFDPAAVPAGRQGLALMAQRTELARGRFTVSSAPGSGTRVRMEVPL